MSTAALSREERQIVQRARQGGGTRQPRAAALPDDMAALAIADTKTYPRGVSAETLGLLGQVDALLKADPLPPRWALLRVLSMLEEHYERAGNTQALRMLR